MLAQTISTCEQPTEELNPNHPYGAIWALKFNKNGQYLASAGQSCVVFIWKSINITENSTQLLEETPYREYQGHTADILDVTWSKVNKDLFFFKKKDCYLEYE
jgi:WD40 repeat protein